MSILCMLLISIEYHSTYLGILNASSVKKSLYIRQIL